MRGCLLVLAVAAGACGTAGAQTPPAADRAIDTFTVQRDDPRMLWRAELAIVDSPTPPSADAGWTKVELPDLWRDESRWRQGVAGWYRFALPAGLPSAPQAVYLWRFSMNAAVWFNGEELGRGGRFDEPVARHWNRPLLVELPRGLWRAAGDPRGNELLVRLRVYPGFGHLMPPALGDTEHLRPDFERRMLWQITLGQAAAAITLLALAAAAVLWAVGRWGVQARASGSGIDGGSATARALALPADPAPLLFAGLCACWLLYAVNGFIRDLPVAAELWWPLVHSAVDVFNFLLVLFFHRLIGVRRPRLELLLGATALACVVFYLSVALPLLARWNPLLHALMGSASLYLLVWLGVRARQRRDRASALYALAVLAIVVVSVHDQLLNALLLPDWWRRSMYMSHLLMPLLFLVFAGHLAQRLARSAQAERDAQAERQRIWRDLHDHVGARLLSLVHGARDDTQAALARDALTQLRRLVDSARQRGGAIADLAAEWRLECELRCEQAGIGLLFEASGDGKLDARERDAIEGSLRELVTNTIRHAGARQLQVRLDASPTATRLDVLDDGVGLPAQPRPGQGLANIRQRVAELGGQVAWSTAAGGGTCCRIELPTARQRGVQR